jgi:pimeloyl-ACP methyl ester carboxylesterase
MVVRARMVAANGLEFGLLEAGAGDGPLALCLHGFPDSAHTWRHLLPALADAGFHAVAPFLRGYAPTSVPDDACYSVGALVADAVALHQALDGDGRAVLIGHDWGAEAAYGAAAFAPDRWRRMVALGSPPPALDPVLFGDYQQLKRFFYLFWFRDSLARAAEVVAADGMAVLDRLWRDWSPGYDAAEDLVRVKDSLRQPTNLLAAISYYLDPVPDAVPGAVVPYAAEERAAALQPQQPTLYLHGSVDGCIGVELARGAERQLAPGSRMLVVDGAGHFPHLERPAEVNEHILAWASGDQDFLT